MKWLVTLLLALVAACSEGQSASQTAPDHAVQTPSAVVQPKFALTGRVTDKADILTADEEAALTKRLAELEQATSHQVVVVTVKTLDGQDIADFTREQANAWGVGRKDYDDGVVLLVAPNERMLWIAVGYGLERALPDALCQQIINDQILPHFRHGDFPRGIEAGIIAITDRLRSSPSG